MTKNAKKLLDFLRKYIEKNKISPNYEEMKEHMGLKSKSSIFQYLEYLEEQGHIKKDRLKSRSIEINNLIRERDITTAEKSISALNDRITKTNLSEVKNALSTLIQEQTKTIVFAESTEEYAFITISPAYVPEIKHSPSRALIVSLGLLLGITLGIFLILLINLRTKHYE